MTLHCKSAFVTLASRNFATLTQFYCQFLEQEPQSFIPNVYAEFQLPDLRLGIFKPSESASPPPLPLASIGMSLCLEVEDLEAAIAHLTDLNCSPPGSILTASHGKEIYAYDPDGNCLVLHQALD